MDGAQEYMMELSSVFGGGIVLNFSNFGSSQFQSRDDDVAVVVDGFDVSVILMDVRGSSPSNSH